MTNTINSAFTLNSPLMFGADRMAAIRLAIGAALAHPETAKLSNSAIARQIGCGVTTVRCYRKIADAVGITATLTVGAPPVIQNIPLSLVEKLRSELFAIIDMTEEAVTPFGKQVHRRAKTLNALLDQQPTESDLIYVRANTEKLIEQADTLDNDDFI